MDKNKLPSLISILILTLLTAIVWVSLSIYRALTVSAPPSVPQNVSQSLTPTLDQSSISKIESGIFFNDTQIPQNVVNATSTNAPVATLRPSPTPTLEATPTASPSATLFATPSATPSATP